MSRVRTLAVHLGEVLVGYLTHYPDEKTVFVPVPETLEDCIPFPERSRQVPPWTTGSDNPENSLDKQAVICTASASVTHFAQA